MKFNNENGEVRENLTAPNYREELVSLIKSGLSPKALLDRLSDYHESDLADAFEVLEKKDREKLYKILDDELLSGIFEYIEDVSKYFDELNIKKKLLILSNMDSDKALEILSQLERSERNNLIDLMDIESKADIVLLSSFDEDEIGSKMTTNYVEISAGVTIKEAMSSLVEQAADNDNISTLYVVDDKKRFCGAINLKDLIIARNSVSLEDITTTSFPYIYANELISDCIERLKDYEEDSIPILDNNNKLLGVITASDIVELVGDELGDDYAKLAGLASEEELSEPIKQSVKKRLPWLIVLLGLGLVVSSVIGVFESVVSQLTIIVCFQSLILDMAGNVGTQSLAVTIRVLMDEQLSFRQKLGLIFKEGKIGFTNGLVLGSLSFFFVGLYLHFLKGNPLSFSFAVSACIGSALLFAMIISSISGTVIPLFFKKIKVDPAVASGPLITTVNDLVAVVSYYGLAWLILIKIAGIGAI